MLVQRSEGNIGCHSSGTIHLGLFFSFHFETSSLNSLKHIEQLNWLVGEPRGSACLCLPSARVTMLAMTHSFFYMASGNWTQVLRPVKRTLCWLACPPSTLMFPFRYAHSYTHHSCSRHGFKRPVYNSKQNGQRTLPIHWSVYSSRNNQGKTVSV